MTVENTTFVSTGNAFYPNFNAFKVTYGPAFENAFADVGMPRTSDSGQINWSTLTESGTVAYLSHGYTVHALPDNASGSNVFFRIDYMWYHNQGYLGFRFRFGTGTDGAGNLTGAVATAGNFDLVSTWDVTVSSSWLSSDGHGFSLVFNIGSASANCRAVLIVDRHRDSTGAATTKGWGFFHHIGTSPQRAYSVDTSDNSIMYTSNGRWPIISLGEMTAITSSRDATGATNLFPLWPSSKQGSYNSKMAMGITIADMPPSGLFTITHLGTARTYKIVDTAYMYGFDHMASAGVGLAIWWNT